MKRTLLFSCIVLLTVVFTACEDPAKSGNTYTVDKAVKDGIRL